MAAVSAAAASAAVFLLATIAGTSTPPSFYRSTEAIHTLLKRAEAEHPGRLRVETHRLRQTRDLFDYVDVACIAARQQPARLKALVVCGEHGRELITAEIGLHLIEDAVQDALSSVDLCVIPILSTWSRDQAERGRPCTRKNARGVDLNRNWPFMWNGDGASPTHADETYPGQHPFSEAESRLVRDLVARWRPDLYINVHSGLREMYFGWDHKVELIDEAEYIKETLFGPVQSTCRCTFGGGGEIGGYLAYGTSMDYMYAEMGINVSLTFEVYGDERSASDCFRLFNPVDRETYDEVLRSWTQVIRRVSGQLAEDYGHGRQ